MPSVEAIGVGATNGISALIAILGHLYVLRAYLFCLYTDPSICSCIWLTIRYGDRMRAYVDVGYATAAD